MNWLQKNILYWVAPSLMVGGLIGMYFSDINLLMSILAPQVNRELGLLEGLQNLALLAIIVVIGMRVYRADKRLERGFFLAAMAASLFMLLEELDYGAHYWWLINGWDLSAQPKFSLHNIDGDRYLDFYKKGGDVLMALWFVIFAWATVRVSNKWVQFLRPSRMFTVAFVASILVSDGAHYLEENIPPTPHYLGSTIGEFRELFTYYIWLIYFITLALFRPWPGADNGPQTRTNGEPTA